MAHGEKKSVSWTVVLIGIAAPFIIIPIVFRWMPVYLDFMMGPPKQDREAEVRWMMDRMAVERQDEEACYSRGTINHEFETINPDQLAVRGKTLILHQQGWSKAIMSETEALVETTVMEFRKCLDRRREKRQGRLEAKID